MQTGQSTFLLILAFLVLPFLPVQASAQERTPPSGTEPFPYAAYEDMTIKGISMDMGECPWCPESITTLAHDLVTLREGEAFTEKGYRASMDALQLSKRFEEITASMERVEDGMVMNIRLKPSRIVKDITTEGDYPLFESDILKAMSVYVGDALMPGMLAEQERLIAELYRKEGYTDPEVSVTARDLERGTVVLEVRIRPGRYYTLRTLTIRGSNAVTEAEIKSRMSSWRQSFFIRESGRFLESDLAQDVKDLREVYWQRGYPECDIEYSFEKDPKDLTVTAEVNISEGPKYDVHLKGNRHFWSYTLNQDIVVFKEGNRHDRGLRKSINNMVDRYRSEGFLFTTVDILQEKETHKDARRRSVEMVITEGPRTMVDAVSFSGNSAFPHERLKKSFTTGTAPLFGAKTFNPDVLEEDLAGLKALYLKEGFKDVALSHELTWSEDKTSVSVAVQISEGPRTLVSSFRFQGLVSVTEKQALRALGLAEGMPYRESLVKTGQTVLSDLISEKGHPYVTVEAETRMNEDGTRAEVVYTVDEGPLVTMGNIYYRGNFTTRTSVIRRELGIETGEPFSLKAMLEGQKNIRDMQAFESVQFKTMGIKEKQDKVTLLVDMEEVKPYYLQAGFGYVSDRGLYGNAKAGDRNLFGQNKHAWLDGELSQIGYRGDLGLNQQRIFGLKVMNTFSLSYEKKEEFNQIFGTRVATSALSFLWEHEPHITTSLGLRYELRDQFLQDSSDEIPEGEEDAYQPRSILVTTPAISYDTRDSFVRPTKGTYSSYSVDISKGYQTSLDNFLKHYVNLRLYYTPMRRLTLAWLGRFGYIDPYGKDSEIPDDQLLYLGGTMSVRGFDENKLRFDENGDPVGGRLAVAGSMEARIEVSRNWETALFFDAGTVRRPLVDKGSDEVRTSTGIGMRYVTPIGPVGILYGHKLDRKEGESAGRFHISVGYTF